MKDKLNNLWNIADVFFRAFIFVTVMSFTVEDGSVDVIWLAIAYITGIIYMLSPLKKEILD